MADTIAPVITNVVLPTQRVVVTSRGYELGDLGFQVTFTEEGSGFSSSSISWRDPSGTRSTSLIAPNLDDSTGTPNAGTVTFRHGSLLTKWDEIGEWKFDSLRITDARGNQNWYDATALSKLGFDVSKLSLFVEQDLTTPFYKLTATASQIDEGKTVTFNLSTDNIAEGAKVNYQISGVSQDDVMVGPTNQRTLTGSMTVGTYGEGKATLPVFIFDDSLTEGTETLTFSAGGQSVNVTLNDTSTTRFLNPTYSIRPSATVLDEGGILEFSVSTTDVPAGSQITYSVSGVQSADILGGQLSGSEIIGTQARVFFFIPLVEDRLTEGPETMIVTVANQSVSILINDTSKTAVVAAPVTYAVSSSSMSVSEGGIGSFTVSTTGVAAGTSLSYSVLGLNIADVVGGALTGTVVLIVLAEAPSRCR